MVYALFNGSPSQGVSDGQKRKGYTPPYTKVLCRDKASFNTKRIGN